MQAPPTALVLASTSRYRSELLSRLRLAFTVVAPAVDETPRAGEACAALALRLARDKALDVARARPDAVVIGADQVADLDGEPLGKPGHHAAAVAQLRRLQGRRVRFETAVCVAALARGFERSALASTVVEFRRLSDGQIEAYLQAERPYDCAGSAKAEGLGIALLGSIESDDPTALIGLPLIRTCSLLAAAGLDPLQSLVRGP